MHWHRDLEGWDAFWPAAAMEKKPASHFAITFTNSDFAPNYVPLVPTQIYASVLDFAHYFVLILAAKHLKEKGQVAGLYLILYSVGRFILEFYRGDLERGNVGILSTSQFISIFTLCAGLLLFLYGAVRKKTVDMRI